MNTSSFFPGTLAPGAPPEEADHVDVEFQFPDATEYLSAEKTGRKIKDKNPTRKSFLQVRFCLIILSIC
jgi:hypothetical protein